jgi:hypothetical protein
MKLYELIAEIERRGIKITICDDGRLKVEPLAAARDLLDEMKRRRDDLEAYARGMYWPGVESLSRELQGTDKIFWYDVADRYPKEVVEEAKRNMWAFETISGFFRLPTEREIEENRKYWAKKRRRAA